MTRKGIILAGGTGSRLHPSTISVSKQLMPVFDKPMIYYPLTTLIQAGMKEILIITTPHDQAAFQTLLGDGSHLGLQISYAAQPSPDGLAQALIIAREFLGGAPSALILGDNLFFGDEMSARMTAANAKTEGATIFGYPVRNPARYGVVGFDSNGVANSLEEKPDNPKSNYAVTGLYFYDGDAPDMVSSLAPSKRGELEITDLNRLYMKRGDLTVEQLSASSTWLDTGTHRSLLAAAQFVAVLEERQGLRIGAPEVAAYRAGLITSDDLAKLAEPLEKSGYGEYLRRVSQT